VGAATLGNLLGAAGRSDATAMIGRACLDLEARPRRDRIGGGEGLASREGSEEAVAVVEGRRYRAIGAERKGLMLLCFFSSRSTSCVCLQVYT
jgi:hypothetical protein